MSSSLVYEIMTDKKSIKKNELFCEIDIALVALILMRDSVRCIFFHNSSLNVYQYIYFDNLSIEPCFFIKSSNDESVEDYYGIIELGEFLAFNANDIQRGFFWLYDGIEKNNMSIVEISDFIKKK